MTWRSVVSQYQGRMMASHIAKGRVVYNTHPSLTIQFNSDSVDMFQYISQTFL